MFTTKLFAHIYMYMYMYICACSGGECVLSGTCAHHCWSMLVSSARVVHVHVCTYMDIHAQMHPLLCVYVYVYYYKSWMYVIHSYCTYVHVHGHDFNHPWDAQKDKTRQHNPTHPKQLLFKEKFHVVALGRTQTHNHPLSRKCSYQQSYMYWESSADWAEYHTYKATKSPLP